MAKASPKGPQFYSITYRDPREGSIQTIKAKKILDSALGLSFIAISEFMFDTDSLVVNPIEEGLALRFENTKVLHLSIYSVVAIEELGKNPQGLKFKENKSELKILRTDFDA